MQRTALRIATRKLDSAIVSAYNYTVNSIGQRKQVLTTGTAFNGMPGDWERVYDSMGQLTIAEASVPANSRAYQYDTIGNRLFSEISNFEISNPPQAATTSYTTNPLNQYTAISGGGFQPPSPTYNLDGNMESGPVLPEGATIPQNATLAWDAENRLTSTSVNGTTITYAYDAFNRLIARTSTINDLQSTILYLYDAWNRIAEYRRDNSTFNLHSTYLWGLDLSGTLQGAGGVGGLLAIRHFPLPPGEGQGEGQSTVFYPCFDGNANISEYLTSTGAVAAHFEYDPFGNLTADSFSNAADFPYRFSTKPTDPATGLLYYGRRWYDPPTGRWPSRDGIGEKGGINLYGFLSNDGVNFFDYLGNLPGIAQKNGKKVLVAGTYKCGLRTITIARNGVIHVSGLFGFGEGEHYWISAEGAERILKKYCRDEVLAVAIVVIGGTAISNGGSEECASQTSHAEPPKKPAPNPQGGEGNPFLPDDPYSPENVSKRQSETRREMGLEPDPDSPIPDQPPGENLKGNHKADQSKHHGTGERNVGTVEEHSRVHKGSHGMPRNRQ